MVRFLQIKGWIGRIGDPVLELIGCGFGKQRLEMEGRGVAVAHFLVNLVALEAGVFAALELEGVNSKVPFLVCAAVVVAAVYAARCVIGRRSQMKNYRQMGDVAPLFSTRVVKLRASEPLVKGREEIFRPSESRTQDTARLKNNGTQNGAPSVNGTAKAQARPVNSDNGYVVPQKKAASIDFGPARPLDTLSTPDLLQEIHVHGHMIAVLIRDSKERIQRLDTMAADRMHLIDGKVFKAMTNARRIIGALENRLERLKGLTVPSNTPSLIKARSLICSDLVIPCDAVNALLSSEELPALQPVEWQPTINKLLDFAEQELQDFLSHRRAGY